MNTGSDIFTFNGAAQLWFTMSILGLVAFGLTLACAATLFALRVSRSRTGGGSTLAFLLRHNSNASRYHHGFAKRSSMSIDKGEEEGFQRAELPSSGFSLMPE